MPDKKTILSTRPVGDDIIRKAAAANVVVEVENFIETKPVANAFVKQQISNIAEREAIVVFTSMNAVEAVASALDAKNPGWKIFALGTATRKLATTHFTASTITGGGSNATELAEIIISEAPFKNVVFFCGNERRDELPVTLTKNGFDVNEIVVYETILRSHQVKKDYDGILFFSPSAVESFFKTKQHLSPTTILFAIGKTTAACIEQYATNKVITSDQPGKEALIAQAISYFNTINHHQ